MAEPVKFLSSRFLSATTLVGANVKNPQDESLGEIRDFMIDTVSGKLAYAVLSFGGVLGMGNKLFAIPWDSFRVDPDTERLLLDVPKERLKNAPGFDADHWPNFAEPTVEKELRQHYGRRSAGDGNIIHPE